MTIDQQQEWARIAQERVAARLAAQPGQQDPAPTAEPEWTAEDEQDDPEPEGVFPDPDPALADTMPVILLPQEDFDTVWHAPHMKFDHAAAVTTSSTTDATAAVVSAEPAALHPEPLHLPMGERAWPGAAYGAGPLPPVLEPAPLVDEPRCPIRPCDVTCAHLHPRSHVPPRREDEDYVDQLVRLVPSKAWAVRAELGAGPFSGGMAEHSVRVLRHDERRALVQAVLVAAALLPSD